MSQIDPDGHRRSIRETKKTVKKQAIDDEKVVKHKQDFSRSQVDAGVKRQRTQERTHIESLKAQAQADLDNAEATVRMMYDAGDLPGLDSNDPHYELLRKIAHHTGKNYANQGLTAEELQEILDDPTANDAEADETFEKNNISPVARTEDSTTRQPDQPGFALYYPGITFNQPKNNPNPSTASSRHNHPASQNASSKTRRFSTDTPPSPGTTIVYALQEPESRKGNVIPPKATSQYSPSTRTDNTLIHGGTPSHPWHPPAPPHRKSTPLGPTHKSTIISGTPARPIKPLPRASIGPRPVASHSPPPSQSPRPTNPNPTDRKSLSKAGSQPVLTLSASPPPRPSKVQPPSPGSELFLNRPGSLTPASHVKDSTRQSVPQSGSPPRLPASKKGKGRALSTDSVAGDPHATHVIGRIQRANPPAATVSELEKAYDELKAARQAWDLRSTEYIDGQSLSPELSQLATRLRECQYRYTELKEETLEGSISQIGSHDGSASTSTRSTPHPNRLKRSSSNAMNAQKSEATHPTRNAQIGGSAKASRSANGLPNTSSSAQSSHHSSLTKVNNSAATRMGIHAPTPSQSSRSNFHGSSRDSSEVGQQNEGEDVEDVEDDIGDGQVFDADDDDEGGGNRQPAGPGRSEKERTNKPILADFPYEDRRILKQAKYFALAQLLARGIFKYLPSDKGPQLKHEEHVYIKAWKSACQEAGVDRPYRLIFGKWMSQRRSGYIYHTTKIIKVIVDRHLGFSIENLQRNISLSKARANRGCHMEPNGRAFQSPLVRKSIQAIVFELAHPYGLTYPDLFQTIPSRLIAYVCTILQFIINGYRKGPWNNDRLNARVQGAFFRQFLKDYEKEENASANRKAIGESYRERIYRRGRLLYKAQQPHEDEPMSPAEGTWSSDMEID
ncbi:hypothetical protein V565_223800, partial [Rhizoctonia solani 123E]